MWDMMEVYTRASATTAALFLEKLEGGARFTIKAIKVDGGSKFQAVFEEKCQRRGIKLFMLPPRSPELNGYVERAHGTQLGVFTKSPIPCLSSLH